MRERHNEVLNVKKKKNKNSFQNSCPVICNGMKELFFLGRRRRKKGRGGGGRHFKGNNQHRREIKALYRYSEGGRRFH